MPKQNRFTFPITSDCEWYTMAYSFVRKFLTRYSESIRNAQNMWHQKVILRNGRK